MTARQFIPRQPTARLPPQELLHGGLRSPEAHQQRRVQRSTRDKIPRFFITGREALLNSYL